MQTGTAQCAALLCLFVFLNNCSMHHFLSDMGPKPKSKGKGTKDATLVDLLSEGNDVPTTVEKPLTQQHSNRTPTVDEIVSDPLTKLAGELWSAELKCNNSLYKEQVVKNLYDTELLSGNPSRFQLLEFSGYLENYLWNYFSNDVCLEHVLSIILMVNEKYKAGLLGLDTLTKDKEKFVVLFRRVTDLILKGELPESFRSAYVLFLINTFRNVEDVVVRQAALRYLSLPIWEALSKTRLAVELDCSPQLQKHWLKLQAQKATLSSSVSQQTNNSSTGKTKPSPARTKKRKAPLADTESQVDEDTARSEEESAQLSRDATWFPQLLRSFLATCQTVGESEVVSADTLRYLERFLELLIDLLSQLPSRRFLRTLLSDMHFTTVCARLPVATKPEFRLFRQLLGMLAGYERFQVDDHTGRALTTHDILEAANARIHELQQVAYAEFPEDLRDLVFSSVGELGKRDQLLRHFELLTDEQMVKLARRLRVLTEKDGADVDADLARELVCDVLVVRESELEELNLLSLFPTEELLWDRHQLPLSEAYSGEEVLALPKLNLQFLTIHDYLLRNFTLFRLESAYEIRDDLADAVKRMGAKEGLGGKVTFGGWARMALPIASLSIDEVSKPKLGEILPRHVDCTVIVDISRFTGDIKAEWEAIREHDVVFLVCIEKPHPEAAAKLAQYEKERRSKGNDGAGSLVEADEAEDFMRLFGVKHVRGGTVFEFRDDADVVLNDPTRPDDRQHGRTGNKRKLRINLDPAQYYADMKAGVSCYESLNLLVRRRPEENNFKAILETIRDLINTAALGRAVPQWLHDVFLGYGNPGAANYRVLNDATVCERADYTDTFVDAQHLVGSFPVDTDVILEDVDGTQVVARRDGQNLSDGSALPGPPYRLEISRQKLSATPSKQAKTKGKKTVSAETDVESSASRETVIARQYTRSNPGPYPQDRPPLNAIRFTPTQVEAIRSGVNPGLTMIVGPPGTGKTDVAVQIIVNLYHNFPTQKILIVTHSNAALNDLFEKIMERDVAPRHLLRLGSGESELRESLAVAGAKGGGQGKGEVFSKQGRVNWSLARRMQLLAQVQFLSASLGVLGDMGNTCETAEYFRLEHVQPRIQRFRHDIAAAAAGGGKTVQELFPFAGYFTETPAPLFTGDWESDLVSAEGCFAHIDNVFQELGDYRSFELLRTQRLRSDYLLTKQARIVAMTCTHAAMTRNNLVELGFKYDSVLMEEAAQILEVETLIPMLLQDSDPVDGSRLKRVVLIGDHHQLPPVVKHLAFQKFCKLDQSLFTRFIRLGVPHVQLDRQGRARPEIAALYNWRYNAGGKTLGNLDAVTQLPQFRSANPGFAHTFQLVDVPAFQGKGESCPTPHFYQNLGEAEYVVATFQYMRLLGYPAERISIITSYNGQKSLIRDIVAQRCQNAVFGQPAHITTVDKFQGQQNDYVLLSLVRTEAVGHLRDVRRLVVALSRARLGLYVFCRKRLFENCYELSPAFHQLLQKPTALQLVAGEGYPATARAAEETGESVHDVADVTALGILVYQMVQQAQHGAGVGGQSQ